MTEPSPASLFPLEILPAAFRDRLLALAVPGETCGLCGQSHYDDFPLHGHDPLCPIVVLDALYVIAEFRDGDATRVYPYRSMAALIESLASRKGLYEDGFSLSEVHLGDSPDGDDGPYASTVREAWSALVRGWSEEERKAKAAALLQETRARVVTRGKAYDKALDELAQEVARGVYTPDGERYRREKIDEFYADVVAARQAPSDV